jgi:hypothetical protein
MPTMSLELVSMRGDLEEIIERLESYAREIRESDTGVFVAPL